MKRIALIALLLCTPSVVLAAGGNNSSTHSTSPHASKMLGKAPAHRTNEKQMENSFQNADKEDNGDQTQSQDQERTKTKLKTETKSTVKEQLGK